MTTPPPRRALRVNGLRWRAARRTGDVAGLLAALGAILGRHNAELEVALHDRLAGDREHPALTELVDRARRLADDLTAHVELAHRLATDAPEDAPGLRYALVPDDEVLVAAIGQADEVLDILADPNDPDTPADTRFDVPPALADGRARDGFRRLADALRARLTPPHESDELDPDFPLLFLQALTTTVTPLRLVPVSPADVALVAEAVETCRRALDPEARNAAEVDERDQLYQLAELLDQMQRDGTVRDTGTSPNAPSPAGDPSLQVIAPIAAVLGVLQLEHDDDVQTLIATLRGRHGDVILTPTAEAAYRRIIRRLVPMFRPDDPSAMFEYAGM